MNQGEALDFLKGYFYDLFVLREVNALDRYLDKDYFDDDIGEDETDHIRNSKEYLTALFQRDPELRVEVVDAICHDDVISAFLWWYRLRDGKPQTVHKGVGIFVLRGKRILKRHTFIYEEG